MVPLTPLLLLPAATLINTWASWPAAVRGAAIALIALSTAVQVSGVVVDYQLQMELMQNAGTLRHENWIAPYSQLVTQPQEVWQVAHGTALYPATHRNPALGRPAVNTWDLWWVYAWITGVVSHRIIIVVLLGLGLGVTLALDQLRRAGRRSRPGSYNDVVSAT